MDPLKRSQVVTKVRRLLQDDAYDADVITDAANWFQDELFNNNHLRIAESSATLTAEQGDTTLDVPDDFKTVIKDGFYCTSATSPYEMGQYRTGYTAFMRQYANFATASQQQARAWTDFGNKIRFAAPLNASHTFQLDYLLRPKHVVRDSDKFLITVAYEEMFCKGTLIRVMDVDEDYDNSTDERNNLAPLQTAFIKNESRGQFTTGPNRIPTNRGRGGYRVDRDFNGG